MIKNIISFVSISVLLVSCSPVFYAPNTIKTPLFSEKGDGDISFAIGTSQEDILRYEGNIAYALSNHVAIMSNYTYFDAGKNHKGSLFEIGAGYFTPLAINNHFIFETYGLLGYGNMKNDYKNTGDYDTYKGYIIANTLRSSAQASIGYKRKNFSIAASTRFSHLNYSDIFGNLYAEGNYEEVVINYVDFLRENRNHFFLPV